MIDLEVEEPSRRLEHRVIASCARLFRPHGGDVKDAADAVSDGLLDGFSLPVAEARHPT